MSIKRFIASLLILIATASHAGAILPAPEKIASHSYAWIGPLPGPSFENKGYRMNLGFVVGTNGIVVIDTGYTEAMATEMLAHIRKISKAPIVAAVNTNSQPHRFMGNRVFEKAGAKIIGTAKGHARMRDSAWQFSRAIERVLKLKENSIPIPAMPGTLIDKPMDIDLGGVRVTVKNLGTAHTATSLVVHVHEDNLVYSSDILYGERMLSVLPESNVKQWIATYNKLADYGEVTFVPGHGRPGPLKAFAHSTLAYLQLLHTHMTKSVEADMEAQDAINLLDQSAYQSLAIFDLLAGRNASRAYLEAEKAAFE